MSIGNMSRNSSRDDRDDELVSLALQISAYGVVMITSLVGNLLVIMTYKNDHNELKKQVMGATICHMAIADLITTFVGIPAMISLLSCNGQWLISGEFGVAVCKLLSFAIEVGFAVSALSIVVISVERLLSVFHPLRKILTVKSANVIGAVVWITACCFYAPRLYTINVYKQGRAMFCTSRSSTIRPWREIEACLYSVLFLVTLILYIAIVAKVTCKRAIPGRAITEASQVARSRANRRVIRQGLGVITIHYLCWLPYLWIYVTCVVFQLKIINVCQEMNLFHHFGMFFLGYSNAALNPILYAATNESFRKGCKKVIRASCGSRIIFPTKNSSVRNSRICSDTGQTKRKKSRQNGELQKFEKTETEKIEIVATEPLKLNRSENAVESVELRDGIRQSTLSPRVIIVSSSN